MTADTSERGLERLICRELTGGDPCDPGGPAASGGEGEKGGGWICGNPSDYRREYCVDLAQLTAFLEATRPELVERWEMREDGPVRRKFLARLQGEINKRGTLAVLRGVFQHGADEADLYAAKPTPGNRAAEERFAANRFSITRQLHYSRDETQRSLDLVLFVNGLPVLTFELKNNLTSQRVDDGVEQYQRDRNPREALFAFGRCIAHFAVDEANVRFCTHLRGRESWFLPFDKGWNDGAGNPPNENGLKTDYLWKEILRVERFVDILENYAQIVNEKDPYTGKKKKPKQIWPRYHQLDVVRKLLERAAIDGPGHRYLVQHSAGSGKSNSIAWLAHQLVDLARAESDDPEDKVFETILVVTDRKLLDRQIRDTLREFVEVGATLGHAESAKDLRRLLENQTKLIVTTIQKFSHILDTVAAEYRGRRFAILIDEAHSSQGGKSSAAMTSTLAARKPSPSEDDEPSEAEMAQDIVRRAIERVEGRVPDDEKPSGRLPNVSYFAFTATPKNKTLELFGTPGERVDGKVPHYPFHTYTMKQAIEEEFILDVLQYFTPVESYYRLAKTVDEDPEFDTHRAKKKLRRYVERHEHAIRLKAEIMVDHFHDQVLRRGKIGGEARAMVVTSGVEEAIRYYRAIERYLEKRKSPYRAIVAFSESHEVDGVQETEVSLNGFPSSRIEKKVREDPYRFLVCADKFQTGYDEPLLHTMYVDKALAGVQAVQTLSRLNRAHPKKREVFVLDFRNSAEAIRESFAPFYRATVLSDETDPNRLHDLLRDLETSGVYTPEQLDTFVRRFVDEGVDRGELDPILDACAAVYSTELDEDEQVAFKGKAKSFLRLYAFLSTLLTYRQISWERASIFLTFLVPKLPAPVDEDLSRGILASIDMESYRVEKQKTLRIELPDEDAEIDPVPVGGAGRAPDEVEIAPLSVILHEFNERFGTDFTDADAVFRRVQDLRPDLEEDPGYKNAMRNADKQNARIEMVEAVQRLVMKTMQDDGELFKAFLDNEGFRRWMVDYLFDTTYRPGGQPGTGA